MKKRGKNISIKLSIIFITTLFLLISTSFSFSLWYEDVDIPTEIQVGDWTGYWARMYDDPFDLSYEFPGPSWATYIIHQPTETPTNFYLYEGQISHAGELNINVWKDSDYLYIEYDLDVEYTMSIIHVHIGLSLDDVPQTPDGNPNLGEFDYTKEYDPEVSNDIIQIDWDSNCREAARTATCTLGLHREGGPRY